MRTIIEVVEVVTDSSAALGIGCMGKQGFRESS